MVKTESLIDPKFLGIPYKLGGKDCEGADCIGIAILWLREQGVEFDYDDGMGPVMAHWWEHNPRRFLEAFLSLGGILHWPELRKFDCVLLLGDEVSSYPSCLGIMVDNRHLLLSFEKQGSHVSMLNKHWKERFWGAIRLHKVMEKYPNG